MYILISAVLFKDYPKETRLNYVKRYYDAISQFKINIPTPVMAGVRTPLRQFASCVLVDSDDTLPSIFSSDMAMVGMLHKGLVLVSTLVEYAESILKFVVEKYSTQGLYLSSRNLNLLSDVVPKMVFVVEVLLSTFQSGIKRLRTLLFSKTIKEQKIIESEN